MRKKEIKFNLKRSAFCDSMLCEAFLEDWGEKRKKEEDLVSPFYWPGHSDLEWRRRAPRPLALLDLSIKIDNKDCHTCQ